MFTPPSGGDAETAQRRGRSTVPVDGPPATPPPLTASQTLDAAASILLDDAVNAASRYIEGRDGDGAIAERHRKKLVEAAASYATVRAAADAARAASAPCGEGDRFHSGEGSGASAVASGIAAIGMGTATGAVLATAVHADD